MVKMKNPKRISIAFFDEKKYEVMRKKIKNYCHKNDVPYATFLERAYESLVK